MTQGIRIHVWGDLACFTRPELKVERYSYEVMTPTAAKGILSAIYWKPEFEWVVDRIHVLRPIRYTQIRRNELAGRVIAPSSAVMKGEQVPHKLGQYIEDERQQRAATLLRDVAYVIEARVRILKEDASGCNSVAKHLEVFKRRAGAGQCFHQPYFGTREFPVMFELLTDGAALPESSLSPQEKNRHLGLMLHEIIYSDCPKKASDAITCVDHDKSTKDKRVYKTVRAVPHFVMASLQDGVLIIPPLTHTLS